MIDLRHYYISYFASLFNSSDSLPPQTWDLRTLPSGAPQALAPLLVISDGHHWRYLFKLAHIWTSPPPTGAFVELCWIQWIHWQCQLKLKTSIPRLLPLLIRPRFPVNVKAASDWHFIIISLPWLISGSAPDTASSVQSGFVRNTDTLCPLPCSVNHNGLINSFRVLTHKNQIWRDCKGKSF